MRKIPRRIGGGGPKDLCAGTATPAGRNESIAAAKPGLWQVNKSRANREIHSAEPLDGAEMAFPDGIAGAAEIKKAAN